MILIVRDRKWRFVGATVFLIMLFVFAFFFKTPQVLLTTSSDKLRPIYAVGTERKEIAISFDACWGAAYTDDILTKLSEHDVKTTFFLVNIWLEDYPDVAKRIAEAGHEIGLHSTSHPHFTSLSEEQIKQELLENHQMISELTGYTPKVFRPPFGDYDNKVINTSRALGYHVIQWDVDSLDWKDLSAREIYNRVIKQVKPGSIVLFHNNGKHTAEALDPILDTLQAQGYDIIPISKLLLPGDYYVDHQGIQRTQS